MTFDNRITRLLGVRIPIVQAPMGWVAQAPLVAAVAAAGAVGLIPGSMGTDAVADAIRHIRSVTDEPFGVNLPIAFLRDP